MNPELRNRPLRATVPDSRLWVDRAEERSAVLRAIGLGFNVLLLGDPGAGKTSFLNWLAHDIEEDRRIALPVSARRAEHPQDLLNEITTRLEHGEPRPLSRPPLGDSVDAAYQALLHASSAGGRPIVLVDDVPGRLGHELFGRMRDELWTLNLQWVVAGRSEDEGVLLLPPADAFFETVRYLEPLSFPKVETLVSLRDPEGMLPPPVITAIAENSNGNPATALRLARQAIESPDPRAAVHRGTIVDQVAEALGRPAARLADELARSGPASPSDPELLRRLGWSRPRAYQVFQELEKAGFVAATEERSGRPGRPRKTYRLAQERR
jgi:hypothetical protein